MSKLIVRNKFTNKTYQAYLDLDKNLIQVEGYASYFLTPARFKEDFVIIGEVK